MEAVQISDRSSWDGARIASFLGAYQGPLRIAANGRDGFPLLCSLWFQYAGGRLLCATQHDAKIARLLGEDERCGFEVAPNDPPYMGVRGRGRALMHSEGAGDLLGRLIDRYLDSRESELAGWLLKRADREVVIEIVPSWVSAWDYSGRMSS